MKIKGLILCVVFGAIISLGVGCHGSGSGFIDDDLGSGGDDPAIGTIESLSIVRLDGESLALAAGEVLRPVPLVIESIQVTFAATVEDTSAVENAASIVNSRRATVAGTFSWNGDATILTFVPESPFEYEATYTISAADEFGVAVDSRQFKTMTKGDVNGDGIPDITIGAYNDGASPPAASVASPLINFAETPSGSGAAYVYSGANLTGDALAKITGIDLGDRFGALVAAAGDVNVDGYADIAVGAVELLEEGIIIKVHIFSGVDLSRSMTVLNAFVNFTFEEDGLNNVSVANVGDANGDGIDDLLFGLYMKGDGVYGAAYLFAGGLDLVGDMTTSNAIAAIVPNGEDEKSFAFSVAGAGDVNGDSYADIIVGAPSALSVGAFIFSGASLSGELTTNDALAKIERDDELDSLGYSVAGVGDVTGDGRDDIAIGAPSADINLGMAEGGAYIFSGASLSGSLSAGVDATAVIAGTSSESYFGRLLAGAGDVTGDGIADIMIVAPIDIDDIVSSLYIFAGGNDLTGDDLTTDDATATIVGALTDARRFAYSIAGISDVTGDGRPDIIVGSRDVSSYGAAYIFSGADLDSNNMDEEDAIVTITGDVEGDLFGAPVAGQ